MIFLGTRLFTPADDYPCREACEANGSGVIDIADMVFIASYIFTGGPPPVAPFPDCGDDPEPEIGYGCNSPPVCP